MGSLASLASLAFSSVVAAAAALASSFLSSVELSEGKSDCRELCQWLPGNLGTVMALAPFFALAAESGVP